MMGANATGEYELRGGEVGALLITTRRQPDDSWLTDQRKIH